MTPMTTSAFALPGQLAPKAEPALIAADERHFAAVADSLEHTVQELSDRLDALRREPGGIGREAMERDAEIHRLTGRLRALRRFGIDLCLGHTVGADDAEPCTSDASASPTARVAACSPTGAHRPRSRSSRPPTPTRWG